jgi:outer membrane protein OmpA-like peptidoglycan-associated protein
MCRYMLLGLLLLVQAACAQADIESDKTRPDLVSIGMTIRQVEALMGRSPESCWNYLEGKYEEDRICFREGKANSGLVGEESARWRQPRFLSRRGVVEASEADVERAWGPPDTVDRSYWHTNGDAGMSYVAVYKQGRLAKFTPIAPPPFQRAPHCAPPMLFFNFGSADLSAPGRKWVTSFISSGGACNIGDSDKSQICVTVTGHSDQSGSDEANQQLSQRRAEAVAKFIVALGFPRERIVVTAKGSSQPMILKPVTPDGREPQNRRVTISLEVGKDPAVPCQ